MGVSNLWQLLEPARTPLHDSGTGLSLAGPAGSAAATADKVLAVDVSIWLQQLVKGAKDRAKLGTDATLHGVCVLCPGRGSCHPGWGVRPLYDQPGVQTLRSDLVRRRMRMLDGCADTAAMCARVGGDPVRPGGVPSTDDLCVAANCPSVRYAFRNAG